MKGLYRFYWDCGRQGDVEGLFIATREEVLGSVGREAYFGEILGKHSEVFGELSLGDFELVSEDQEKIEWIEELLGTSISGYNPLDYLEP